MGLQQVRFGQQVLPFQVEMEDRTMAFCTIQVQLYDTQVVTLNIFILKDLRKSIKLKIGHRVRVSNKLK